MSYQFDGACYPTALAANRAAASTSIGTVQGFWTVNVTEVTDTTINYWFQDISTGAYTLRVVNSNPQPCQLLGTSDALSIAWSIIGVWVSVYAVKMLIRLIERHFNVPEVQ